MGSSAMNIATINFLIAIVSFISDAKIAVFGAAKATAHVFATIIPRRQDL
jgi:hypothetical protein